MQIKKKIALLLSAVILLTSVNIPQYTVHAETTIKSGTTVVRISKHIHNWEYTADGATLTAECKENAGTCDVPNRKASLTLSANYAEYSGSAVEVSMDTTAWVAAGVTAPEIVYEAKEGSTLTDGKAVNVGSYIAKITFEGKTATVDFTIVAAGTRLAAAKEAANKAIDDEVGDDTSENVNKAADAAKKAIADAATVDAVEEAKNAGIEAIKAAKDANAGADDPTDDKPAASDDPTDDKPATSDDPTDDKPAASDDADAPTGNKPATSYDTIVTKEIDTGNGSKKGITIGNIGQGNTLPINGVITVNAPITLTMLDSKWTPTGYLLSRVTPKNLASAQWVNVENDKKALKELKKLANVRFNEKQNLTLINVKQNKKVTGSVYAIRLTNGTGNTIYMNIECIELNKNIKKNPLTTTTISAAPTAADMLSIADGNNAKTVRFTMLGLDTKSELNANAVVWTVGSGKKAVTLKKGEVTAYKDKKGNAIAYLTVANDGGVKVLAGTVKGNVKLTGTVNMKKYNTAIKVKATK